MRKLQLLTLTLSLTSAVMLRADQLLNVSLNTAAISGTTGSIDLAFDSGALSSQAAAVSVFNFNGATFGGTQIKTGAAAGGPVAVAPVTIANSTASQSNDEFETVTFGNTITFTLDFSGPAVVSPNGTSTSTSQFGFYVFSDANGTVPVLTNDASGVAGLVTVNLNGSLSPSAVSPNLAFSSVPEPATFWLAGIVFGLYGMGRLRRRAAQ